MDPEDKALTSRRDLIAGLLASAGAATGTLALGGCRAGDQATDPLWAGFDERITERTLAEAEKLLGLEFTAAERRLMLGGNAVETKNGPFTQQLAAIRNWREIDKPNGLAPATVFDPRLPGVDYPAQEDAITLSRQPLADRPDSDEDIAYASLRQLAHWMDTDQLSSLELTELYLARIARYDGVIRSFITLTPDLARQQAREADRERSAGRVRGPLHGIPFGLKDLVDTAGIPTTWGADPFRTRVPSKDGAVTRRLRQAGGVLLGKTALGALAWGEVWFGGETRNPWNVEEGSSGSSAGSAAAVAAGFCGFAIGSETWGSIVSPSQRCGVAGLRPTFGRVSRAGAMALSWSLDKIGPICRHAEDTATVLAALNGYDAADAGSLAQGFAYDGNVPAAEITVGFEAARWEGEAVAATGRPALEALRSAGFNMVEVHVPDLPWETIGPILDAEAAAAFEQLTLSGADDRLRRQIANAWPNVFRSSRFVSAVDFLQCQRLRRRIMEQLHDVFGQVDVFIAPDGDGLTALTNLSGHPGMALRTGFQPRRSRPITGITEEDTSGPLHEVPESVYLWAGLFREGQLVRAANAIEQALESRVGWSVRRPALP